MLINVLVQQFSSSQLHFERPQENQMNTVVFDHGSKFFTFPIFLSAKVATFFDEQFPGTTNIWTKVKRLRTLVQTITYAVSFRYKGTT
jgi:hypothetical protein